MSWTWARVSSRVWTMGREISFMYIDSIVDRLLALA